MNTAAIILAAGAGTRMKSKKPKVAHEMMGKPLVNWVIDAANEAGIAKKVAVVGHMREIVEPLVEGEAQVVEQRQQLGTANAVEVCKEAFAGFDGSLLVLSGDCPLITADTMRALVETRERDNAAVVVLTMQPDDPFGYGRIIRDADGQVERIVEQKDATPEEAAVGECNSGFYCFDARALFDALEQVGSDNAQGEYYLTDVLEICRKAGRSVLALPASDDSECLGINSRVQLAQATKIAQRRINGAHLAAGVTMLDPDQVWIGPDVSIASDVELETQVFLLGETSIGQDCKIGPNVRLTDTAVGERCVLADVKVLHGGIADGTSIR